MCMITMLTDRKSNFVLFPYLSRNFETLQSGNPFKIFSVKILSTLPSTSRSQYSVKAVLEQ